MEGEIEDFCLLRKEKMEEIDEEILEQWVLGNYSQLDKNDLIKIARHFEDKCREEKNE